LYFENSLHSCFDPCTRDYPSNSSVHRRYNEDPFLEVISFRLRVEEKMKKLVLLVVVVGFACLFTGAALGDIIQVPTHYPTIQAGIDAASSGDTVEVAPGTYYENITMKSGVVIQGSGAGDDPSIHSIIDGGGTGSVVTASGVGSEATLDGFKITNGGGDYGGGMVNNNSSPTVANCTFSENSAGSDGGGGMYNRESSPTVTNCTFSGNSTTKHGGGMYNYASSPSLTNCTFSKNSAGSAGGGMRNYSSSPWVTNCILWGDTPQEIDNYDSSPVVTHSDIQGGYPGTGNINADPMFVDPDGPDNIPGNQDDDFHLKPNSPCIDSGDNSAPALPATDFDGDHRRIDNPWVTDTGNGTTPIVDIGADEFEILEADFTSTPTNGVAPLTVNFTEKCAGYTTSWSWDFGDSSTSTERNPTHTYIDPGTYTVSLTVTGLGESDNEIKMDYINVRERKGMPWLMLLLEN
jgi:hypothetical protein